MGTVSGGDAPFGFPMGLEPPFSHDAFHPFMIDAASLPLQLLGDAPIAIAWPLASNGCNGLLISGLRVMILGTAGAIQYSYTHLTTSPSPVVANRMRFHSSRG